MRFAVGENKVLEPFPATVGRKFEAWLETHQNTGKKFTPEQMEWLMMIKDQIATSLRMTIEDFEYTPFNQKGGAFRAYKVLGNNLGNILEELNRVLLE